MTKFQQFMAKVLEPVDLPPDPETKTDQMVDWALKALERNERIIVYTGRHHGKSIVDMVLQLQNELAMLRPVVRPQRIHIEPSKFLIDELMKLDRHLARLAEEPEPEDDTAKNGMKANRTTARAKAKLPFYHKNRRF